MNDLIQQAQFHAKRCEFWSRRAMLAPSQPLNRFADQRIRNSCANLARFHSLKAFELSAQAARL